MRPSPSQSCSSDKDDVSVKLRKFELSLAWQVLPMHVEQIAYAGDTFLTELVSCGHPHLPTERGICGVGRQFSIDNDETGLNSAGFIALMFY